MQDATFERGAIAAPPSASGSLWWLFGLDCALATVVRLVLAWMTGGYATDLLTFQSWATTLRDHPLRDFYASAHNPDHLPGDLWLLKAVESLYTTFGGQNLYGRDFALVTQVVPTLGDLLSALMLVLIVRRFAGEGTAGTCARWYLLNPATIILTGVWGQWDSVSLGVLLTGVWLLLREDRLWWVSGPFFAWALLIKPQLAVAVVCLLPIVWRQCMPAPRPGASRRRSLAGVPALAAWVGSGIVTAYVVLAPFSVHLLRASGDGSTLLERVRTALDLYPFTTVGAANIWMLPIDSLDRVRDDSPGWLGFTDQEAGTVLLGLALLAIGLTWWLHRHRIDVLSAAVWAATASTLAGFLLSTRVHERYALPVLGLALLLLATHPLDRRLTTWFWLASACLTLNQVLVLFGGLEGPGGHRLDFGSGWWIGLSTVYVLLAATLFAWPFGASAPQSAGSSSRTYPASRPS